MDSVIYDLKYDFAQQNGNYMIFTEKNNRLLEEDDLVSLQMKMIQANVIPFVIPIIFEEMDFKIRLHYEITSKRMFSVYLREKSLKSEDFYALFLRIIDVLGDSKLYLLDQNRYLLREDFIFIGKDIQEVFLTYLPLKAIPGKSPVEKDLKELLTQVASQTDGLEGKEFKAILSYVNDPSFNLEELKDLLTELQSNQSYSYANDEQYVEPSTAKEDADAFEIEHEPVRNVFYESPSEPDPKYTSSIAVETPAKETMKLPDLTQREKVMMVAFAGVTLALIWKWYGSYPEQSIMDICSGLSVLVIISIYVYWKKWRPGFHQTVTEGAAFATEEGGFEDRSFSFSPEVESRPLLWDGIPQNPAQLSRKNEDYYEHLNENTTMLPQSDDTVMLGSAVSENQYPYLVKELDGQSERIEVAQASFVIGRNPEVAQYVVDSANVSRTHLEIVMMEEGYAVKDLGSKNGSFLNEQSLVPYKLYNLKDQDRITVGKVNFSFRLVEYL